MIDAALWEFLQIDSMQATKKVILDAFIEHSKHLGIINYVHKKIAAKRIPIAKLKKVFPAAAIAVDDLWGYLEEHFLTETYV